MSDEKNAETVQDPKVTPAPSVTPATQASVTPKPESTPADPTAENKNVSAFIKMRKDAKASKLRIAELESKIQAAPVVTPEPQPVVASAPAPTQTVTTVAPTPAHVAAAEVSEEAAIQELAKDKDVMSVPGGIIDIMDLVDSDPKLVRLNEIDPTLAFREAKAMWTAKLGIGKVPLIPAPSTPSGGMGGEKNDLQALFDTVDAAKPGTKAYRDAVKAVNAAMAKG